MAARATDGIEYNSFSQAINLYAVKDRDIERLEILTASAGATITCKTKDGGDVQRVYHVAQGDKLELAIRSLESVTGVTLVRACWGDF
jgi:hypothetical protein